MNTYRSRDGQVDVELGLSWSQEEGVVQHRYPLFAKASEVCGAALLVDTYQHFGKMLSPASIHSPVDSHVYMPSAKTRRRVGAVFLAANLIMVSVALTPTVVQGAHEVFLR